MEMTRILPPKYVRRAHQWVVTFFTVDPKAKHGEEHQNQKWFSSRAEADIFIYETVKAATTS